MLQKPSSPHLREGSRHRITLSSFVRRCLGFSPILLASGGVGGVGGGGKEDQK